MYSHVEDIGRYKARIHDTVIEQKSELNPHGTLLRMVSAS